MIKQQGARTSFPLFNQIKSLLIESYDVSGKYKGCPWNSCNWIEETSETEYNKQGAEEKS